MLMARLAVSDKEADDEKFDLFFPLIKSKADDDRNMVKKGVNWALRQIGKRNQTLNSKAIIIARELMAMDSKDAKWIGKDALRELSSEKIQIRLKAKTNQ